MMTYHLCSKCDAPVRRSRRRNMWEFMMAVVMLPYRCTACDRREMKFRFINMEPNAKPEDVDVLLTGPTERELEEARIAEAKAAEKAAKKAEKQRLREEAKKAQKEIPVMVSMNEMDEPEAVAEAPQVKAKAAGAGK